MDFCLAYKRKQLHPLDGQQQISPDNLRNSSHSLSTATWVCVTVLNLWMDHNALYNSNLKRKRYRRDYAWIGVRTTEENKVLAKRKNNRSDICIDLCNQTWNRVYVTLSNHFLRKFNILFNGNMDRTRLPSKWNNMDGNYICSFDLSYENSSLFRIQIA